MKVLEILPSNDKIFKASPNQESFKKALEENNLIFTEIKGRFEAIYLPLREPAYVANIRRGILSALQLQFTEEEHTFVTEVMNYMCTACLRVVLDDVIVYILSHKQMSFASSWHLAVLPLKILVSGGLIQRSFSQTCNVDWFYR